MTSFLDNSWAQRIEIHHPPKSLHEETRVRNEVKSQDDTILDASRRELVNFRRAKTDLSESDLGPRRSRLPIFVSNENARVWLDLNNKKSNSLDALDSQADDDSQWHHHDYVNVAPPRPPKFKMAERAVRRTGAELPARRSTPVYVNVYSLGRRRPGDVLQSGR